MNSCKPNTTEQISLFFLHDIIHICGPISHPETINIYKELYGDEENLDDLKDLRGILHASSLIDSKKIDNTYYYTTSTPEPFIAFGSVADELLAQFRSHHLRHNTGRLINV
ncbi:hypothetical protein ISX93_13615 [Pseudomonas sp. N040]|nr:hypothetical protein [Pseudomonas sp. N040]